MIARRAFGIALGWLLWQATGPAASAEPTPANVAIIFPDIGEPYRSVFESIISGIDDKAGERVASFAVRTDTDIPSLGRELQRRNTRVLIALGRNGLKAASAINNQMGIVVGGVLSLPEAEAQSLPVFSLAPDPALLFGRLKSFLPTARRIAVIYDPKQNGWLIRLAKEAARAQGLELLALEADDLKSAIRQYQSFLASTDPRRDVLWLPQDSTTVEESAVLPLVLKEAWNQQLAVISSTVGHVRRGVLFSLYPDHGELGRALAAAALSPAASDAAGRGLRPLKEVLMAVNTRTARHLGIDLGAVPHPVHMVFPEP